MNLAFWSTAALLIAAALLFVLPPLVRPARLHRGPSTLAVYRELRAQADADHAQGRIDDLQHAQALADLQGRVIEEVVEAPHEAAPLERRPGRGPVLAVALLLPAGALALYAWLGKPAAIDPTARVQAAAGSGQAPHTMSREQMEDMVERLAEKMQRQPNDADGWHMLARSYVAFNRLPEAAQAFDRALALAPRNPQVLSDFADVLAMLNGRNLEGRPMELVNAALKIEPLHPKSLSLAGTAAFNRGDFAAAAATWQKLLDSLPPDSDQRPSVAGSVAQAKAQLQAAATRPTAPAAADAAIDGSVSVAEPLRQRVARGATLLVFARAVDGSRMPLAIVKVPAGEFPYRFKLDDSLAMAPQAKLSGQSEVMLAARISLTGNATPQSGDLMGTLGPVKVGARDVRLVIDGVVP